MIRTLIADDEAPARAKLRQLLAAEPDFQVVAEAADGIEAVAAIRQHAPQVVFLDIQMPRLDGFGVVAEIGVGSMPLTVFATAYDEHALRAFEVQALDYLLKPFAATRFRRVLERVRGQLSQDAAANLAQRLQHLLDAVAPQPRYLQRLQVPAGEGREVLVPVERIDLIRAERNYLRLITAGAELQLRGTLSALLERLDPQQFRRINRSEVVRLDAVKELQPWFHGDYRVVLKDGTTLTWSRRYRARSGGEL